MTGLTAIAGALGDGNWLTAARARAWCRILFAVSLLAIIIWVATSVGGIDRYGRPIGTDFVSFWTASSLALAGQPEAAYDVAAHHAAQTALFDREVPYYAFFYPPVFLLLCLPLALLPYWISLTAWLGITGAFYWRMASSFVIGRLDRLVILAFPAVFLTITHGQNAFLTAGLFGTGVLLRDRRQVLAGICYGCLVFKPHLALVIPVALVAAGRWRSLFAAGATALLLIAISYAVLGEAAWRAFLSSAQLAAATLENDAVGYAKMQSVFAAVRLLGGSVGLAYAVQSVAGLAALAAVISLARRRSPAEGPAMALAALLVSPFLLDYDMTLLIIPLAWTTAQGLTAGFRPWEKSVLVAGFVLPAVARAAGTAAHIPLSPLILALLLGFIVARGSAIGGTPSSPTHNGRSG